MSIIVGVIGSPLELSGNFVLSCESDTLNGYSTGDPVSSWTDSSGTGNHATASGSLRPTYNVDANGFKYLKYTRADKTRLVTTNNQIQPAAITICLVLCVDLINAENKEIFGSSTGVNLKDRQRILSNYSLQSDVSGIAQSSSVLATNISTDGQKVVITYRRESDGTISIYRNFLLVKKQVVTFTPQTANFPYVLGTLGPQDNYFMDGRYYQAHVCHEALSDQKIKKLIRYAAFKSGIRI